MLVAKVCTDLCRSNRLVSQRLLDSSDVPRSHHYVAYESMSPRVKGRVWNSEPLQSPPELCLKRMDVDLPSIGLCEYPVALLSLFDLNN